MTKKIIICIGVVLAVLITVNFNYFAVQFEYDFFRAKITPQSTAKIPGSLNPASQANLLTIESLGISVPILYVSENSESVFQDALKSGAVHYPGTALPGQLGNCYIFGHSSDYIWSKGKYKTVFALLPKIAIGDEVSVTDQAGKIYHYQVIKSFVASANDFSLLAQGDKTKSILTLQTSWPLGTALKRWIVIAQKQQ